MILAFILALVVIIFTCIIIKEIKNGDEYSGLSFISWVLGPVFLVGFIIVVINLSITSYNYNQFKNERTAIEYSLTEARKTQNNIELAAVTQKIIDWNIRLEKEKYDKNNWWFKSYVDDRMLLLKPLK